MKFKVGQIVELIEDSEIAAESGATAIVERVNNIYISVVWNRDSKWNNQGDGGYYPKDFKPFIRKGQQLLFDFME